MTMLLALALIAVVWGFIRQGRIMMQQRAAPGQPAATAAAPAAGGGIVLPPGAKILSSSTEAGRLVLRLQGNCAALAGERVSSRLKHLARLVGREPVVMA